MRSLVHSLRRPAAALLVAAALPLGVPTTGLAAAKKHPSDPIAHIALGLMDSAVGRAKDHKPHKTHKAGAAHTTKAPRRG